MYLGAQTIVVQLKSDTFVEMGLILGSPGWWFAVVKDSPTTVLYRHYFFLSNHTLGFKDSPRSIVTNKQFSSCLGSFFIPQRTSKLTSSPVVLL
jgi:hypothetical protein